MQRRDPEPLIDLRHRRIFRDGQALEFEKLEFIDFVGKGANGVVFEANDTTLDRRVAVKIWKSVIKNPETSRALAEVRKLAKLAHPLLVVVHRFDTVSAVPFSVMEFVGGRTLRRWLEEDKPKVPDRAAVWGLFSTALHYVYNRGLLHGDPHVGNALIFEDPGRIYQGFVPAYLRPSQPLGVKLMDLGTSRIWARARDFRQRETRVLVETVKRLFPLPEMELIVEVPIREHPRVVLAILDQFVRYATLLDELCGFRGGSENILDMIDDLSGVLNAAPFFRLSVVVDQLRANRFDPDAVLRSVAAETGEEWLRREPLSSEDFLRIENRYLAKKAEFITNHSVSEGAQS